MCNFKSKKVSPRTDMDSDTELQELHGLHLEVLHILQITCTCKYRISCIEKTEK